MGQRKRQITTQVSPETYKALQELKAKKEFPSISHTANVVLEKSLKTNKK